MICLPKDKLPTPFPTYASLLTRLQLLYVCLPWAGLSMLSDSK